MNRRERGDQLQEQLSEAITELEQQLNEGHTEGFLRLLEFYSRFRKYSPGNVMLILMQRPDASLCAGFRQWEKLGYQVRKGESAVWVRGPYFKDVTDPETGEVENRLIGWLALPIFDVSQLEGDVEIPSFTHPLEGDYDGLYTMARVGIGVQGVLVIEDDLPSTIHGMASGDKITINRNLSDSEKFLCLLHEAAHIVLKHSERHEETSKQQRELCAEATSYLLAKLFGLDNPFSRDYIIAYNGTVEALHESLSEIHLAVRKISGWLEIEAPSQEQSIAA